MMQMLQQIQKLDISGMKILAVSSPCECSCYLVLSTCQIGFQFIVCLYIVFLNYLIFICSKFYCLVFYIKIVIPLWICQDMLFSFLGSGICFTTATTLRVNPIICINQKNWTRRLVFVVLIGRVARILNLITLLRATATVI